MFRLIAVLGRCKSCRFEVRVRYLFELATGAAADIVWASILQEMHYSLAGVCSNLIQMIDRY